MFCENLGFIMGLRVQAKRAINGTGAFGMASIKLGAVSAQVIGICMLALSLVACSSANVDQGYRFDQVSKSKGAMLVGIKSPDTEYEISVSVARYDVEDEAVRPPDIWEAVTIPHVKDKTINYHLLALVPGHYVVQSVLYTEQTSEKVISSYHICLARSTYRFDVKAGEIAYVGDIYADFTNFDEVGMGNIKRIGEYAHLGFSDNKIVDASLRRYLKPSIPSIKTKRTEVSFPRQPGGSGVRELCIEVGPPRTGSEQ